MSEVKIMTKPNMVKNNLFYMHLSGRRFAVEDRLVVFIRQMCCLYVLIRRQRGRCYNEPRSSAPQFSPTRLLISLFAHLYILASRTQTLVAVADVLVLV